MKKCDTIQRGNQLPNSLSWQLTKNKQDQRQQLIYRHINNLSWFDTTKNIGAKFGFYRTSRFIQKFPFLNDGINLFFHNKLQKVLYRKETDYNKKDKQNIIYKQIKF